MSCRAHLVKVVEQWPRIERRGGAAVCVVHDDPRLVRSGLLRDLDLSFPVLIDTERSAYRRWGLGRASFAATYLAPGVWTEYVRVAVREFHGIARPGRDIRQLGGDFVVAPDGSVSLSRPQSGPSDRPPVGELLRAMTDSAKPAPGRG